MASKSVQGAGLQPRHVGVAPKIQAANLFSPLPPEKKKKKKTAAAANSSSHVMPGDGRQRFETALLFLRSSLKIREKMLREEKQPEKSLRFKRPQRQPSDTRCRCTHRQNDEGEPERGERRTIWCLIVVSHA